MLGRKWHSGTSKTKAGQGGLVRVVLFWKSHCAICVPACVTLFHATGSFEIRPSIFGNIRYYPKLSTKVEKELRTLPEKGSVPGFLARVQVS